MPTVAPEAPASAPAGEIERPDPRDPLGRISALPFAALSFLRAGKAFHPKGVAHEAIVVLSGAADAPPGFLANRAEHEAIVRFSRAIGLPRPLPDLLGLSLRRSEERRVGK